MNRIPDREAQLVGVLDLETGLDPIAAALLGATRTRLAGKAAVQRIRAATLLIARTEGQCVEIEFRSWHIDEMGEDEVVGAIDVELANLRAGNGTLVTFNGRRHDLPVLRRRLATHMIFERRGVWDWLGSDVPHIDLITDPQPAGGKWSSLQEEAAGLGIAMPAAPAAHNPAAAVRQSEIDARRPTLFTSTSSQAPREAANRSWRAGEDLPPPLIATRTSATFDHSRSRPSFLIHSNRCKQSL